MTGIKKNSLHSDVTMRNSRVPSSTKIPRSLSHGKNMQIKKDDIRPKSLFNRRNPGSTRSTSTASTDFQSETQSTFDGKSLSSGSSRTIRSERCVTHMRSQYLEELWETPKSNENKIVLPLWTISVQGRRNRKAREEDKLHIERLPHKVKEALRYLRQNLNQVELEQVSFSNASLFGSVCWSVLASIRKFTSIHKKRRTRKLSSIPSESQLEILDSANRISQQEKYCIVLVRMEHESPGSKILDYYLEIYKLSETKKGNDSILLKRIKHKRKGNEKSIELTLNDLTHGQRFFNWRKKSTAATNELVVLQKTNLASISQLSLT